MRRPPSCWSAWSSLTPSLRSKPPPPPLPPPSRASCLPGPFLSCPLHSCCPVSIWVLSQCLGFDRSKQISAKGLSLPLSVSCLLQYKGGILPRGSALAECLHLVVQVYAAVPDLLVCCRLPLSQRAKQTTTRWGRPCTS